MTAFQEFDHAHEDAGSCHGISKRAVPVRHLDPEAPGNRVKMVLRGVIVQVGGKQQGVENRIIEHHTQVL